MLRVGEPRGRAPRQGAAAVLCVEDELRVVEPPQCSKSGSRKGSAAELREMSCHRAPRRGRGRPPRRVRRRQMRAETGRSSEALGGAGRRRWAALVAGVGRERWEAAQWRCGDGRGGRKMSKIFGGAGFGTSRAGLRREPRIELLNWAGLRPLFRMRWAWLRGANRATKHTQSV